MKIAIVIPAFRPPAILSEVVADIAAQCTAPIIIVDDGSGAEFLPVFNQCNTIPRAEVIRHTINQGKGAALKTGIDRALCMMPDLIGVVTADADGQHDASDILRVAQRLAGRPGFLVLGSRAMEGRIPLRSRIGNAVTRWLVHLMAGQKLSDTQTGLRGIPAALLPRLLKMPSAGYEFELDMLLAAKHLSCPIVEEPIRTIYFTGNASSHFNPIRDSMKIYFVLFRFGFLSILTALLDNLVFILAFGWLQSILPAQIIGRIAAVLFNYGAARRAVFLTDERHRRLAPKYLALVILSGTVSYALITFLTSTFPISVVWAKIAAESLLFLLNFVVQRDFVFTRPVRQTGSTDWDRYYRSVPFTAKLTRRYTGRTLIGALRRHAQNSTSHLGTIVEIGGANSCFLDRILRECSPAAYHVVDNNEVGLELLRRRRPPGDKLVLHRQDVLTLALHLEADVVFSVGLVEHFDRGGTREAIARHFAVLRPGGHAVISFPTPTVLYRIARNITESLGLWKFPDERPLTRNEVLESASQFGDLVFEKTLWPLVFTQHLIVVRKHGSPLAVSA